MSDTGNVYSYVVCIWQNFNGRMESLFFEAEGITRESPEFLLEIKIVMLST